LRFAGDGSVACYGFAGTEKSSDKPKAYRNARRALDLIGDKVGIDPRLTDFRRARSRRS
jgi:hypothetical protein